MSSELSEIQTLSKCTFFILWDAEHNKIKWDLGGNSQELSQLEISRSFLSKIFFSQGKYTKGKNRKERWEGVILPCCDFFLYLPKSLWKSSCEACTLTLTDDSHLLLYLTSWVLMLIVHTIFFICCITLREARSTLCMQVQWLPALEEQWILLLLLAGEQS